MARDRLHIGRATPQDLPSIKSCAKAAYAQYVPLIGKEPPPMVADFTTQIRQGFVHVAKNDRSEFQGYIVFFPQKDHIMLENVAVPPQLSGRGIGKALIAYCENTARNAGFKTVRLYTSDKMLANQKIYPKLGYVEIWRRQEFGIRRIYFEKSLAQAS